MAKARAGGGPTLIEALTYRHGGHSRADPGKYRPQQEIEEWLGRDPIPAYRARLLGDGVDAAVLDAIDAQALAAVDQATIEAKEGPPPLASSLLTEVWADGGSAWRS
jgi:pyruvate dehydrogenase E1 component alpha subunit